MSTDQQKRRNEIRHVILNHHDNNRFKQESPINTINKN